MEIQRIRRVTIAKFFEENQTKQINEEKQRREIIILSFIYIILN